MPKYCLFLLAFLIFLPTLSQARVVSPEHGREKIVIDRMRTPSDTESRAAYCLGALNAQKNNSLSGLKTLQPIQSIEDERIAREIQKDNIKRLENFINPRLGLIDNASLFAARAQGARDFKQIERLGLFPRCEKRCAGDDVDDKNECITHCLDETPMFGRVDGCNRLDFLPY